MSRGLDQAIDLIESKGLSRAEESPSDLLVQRDAQVGNPVTARAVPKCRPTVNLEVVRDGLARQRTSAAKQTFSSAICTAKGSIEMEVIRDLL